MIPHFTSLGLDLSSPEQVESWMARVRRDGERQEQSAPEPVGWRRLWGLLGKRGPVVVYRLPCLQGRGEIRLVASRGGRLLSCTPLYRGEVRARGQVTAVIPDDGGLEGQVILQLPGAPAMQVAVANWLEMNDVLVRGAELEVALAGYLCERVDLTGQSTGPSALHPGGIEDRALEDEADLVGTVRRRQELHNELSDAELVRLEVQAGEVVLEVIGPAGELDGCGEGEPVAGRVWLQGFLEP